MAWHTYLNLEKDFIDVTRFVALDKENRATWSEKIAELLLLTGSKVDSLFKEMKKSSLLPQSNSLIALQNNDRPTIHDYRKAYEPIYLLSGVHLIASHGLTNDGEIRPFEAFHGEKSPEWWESYNNVKHGFFQNMREGTLDNLIHALGALFALNVLHKDSQEYLIKNGVIFIGDLKVLSLGIDSKYSWGYSWGLIKNSFVGLPSNVGLDARASSQVFQHQFRKDQSVSA